MHEREQRLAPAGHPLAATERHHRLVPGEVDHRALIAEVHLALCPSQRESPRYVRMLHEAKEQLDACDAFAQRRDQHALRLGYAWYLRDTDRNQKDVTVDDAVVAQVLGERERYSLSQAAEHDHGAGQ